MITLLRFISLFNAIASLQPLMMAQLSDYQQLKTGKRLEGFIQTFLYALVLVFTNIGIVVMAYVKDAMGYQSSNLVKPGTIAEDEFWAPDAATVESALNYYNVAFIVSAVSAALMFITLLFYKLGKKEHAEVVRQLRERGLAQGNEQEEAEAVGIAENVEAEIAMEQAALGATGEGGEAANGNDAADMNTDAPNAPEVVDDGAGEVKDDAPPEDK